MDRIRARYGGKRSTTYKLTLKNHSPGPLEGSYKFWLNFILSNNPRLRYSEYRTPSAQLLLLPTVPMFIAAKPHYDHEIVTWSSR